MSFLGLLPRQKKKASSNSGELLGFDLLYQLTHLSAISAAGISRGQMFKQAAQLPSSTAGYFAEVERLAKGLNYQYAEACRIVGESAKEPEVKSLLLRLSSSMSTGEPVADFMNQEAKLQAEAYGNDYERKLETLKKWTDSYVALMVSVALIIVIATISTVIYNMGTQFVTGLVAVMMLINVMGGWIIYRTAPKEIKTMNGPPGLKTQRTPRLMVFIFVPTSLALTALMLASGWNIGWALVIGGLFLIPIGFTSWMLDKRVNQQDSELSTFLRTMGSIATSIGSTPAEAMDRMELRSIGTLAPKVTTLRVMLRARINPALCWARFVTDTGSELVQRSVRVFLDGINLGGDAEEVGNRASVLTMKVNFMRAKRKLVSTTFCWLSLMTHAAVVFLLIFVLEIVDRFGRTVEDAGVASLASGQNMSVAPAVSFNFENMAFLKAVLIPVVLVLSFINAVTPKVAEGGYAHTFFFYLGTNFLTSGMSLALAPLLATMVFSTAPST